MIINNYRFTIKRAKELNENEDLINEEAMNMKKAFELQENEKHSIEGSFHYGTSVIVDRMFDKVVEEYNKLKEK